MRSAWAHHTLWALFDFNDRVTVSGTLTRLDWRNPHIYVFVDGKSGANQTEIKGWSIEGPPPSFFRAREINRTDIEAAIGKEVTAEVSRARDGSTAGLLRVIKCVVSEFLHDDEWPVLGRVAGLAD